MKEHDVEERAELCWVPWAALMQVGGQRWKSVLSTLEPMGRGLECDLSGSASSLSPTDLASQTVQLRCLSAVQSSCSAPLGGKGGWLQAAHPVTDTVVANAVDRVTETA